jgi:thiol-disulfide isomerase/thioredoxin
MLTRIYFGLLFLVVPFLVTITAAQEEDHGPPTLAIGATAPDFCLKGVDEQTQSLKDYRSSKVLMIAFICNHCPTSQLYETRIERIAEDYKDRGVAVVAIEPNNPNAVRLDEMGYTDVGDSFEEMQIRAEYRHFSFPYLYDGEDQKISNLYGPTATPHVFIFDQDRKLHYEGRVDNNPREPLVTRRDARLALDAVLAGTRIEVAKTPAVGCSTKWLYKEEGRREEMTEIERKPVTVRPVSIDDLRALRKNTTGKLLLVDFWATWCGPCRKELTAFETMYRMYGHRAFDLVTVSINYPDEKAGVEKVLQTEHATSTNLILGSTDLYVQLAAFDPDWNAGVPYTLLIRPDGTIAYKVQSTSVDPLKLKRLIIANLADDDYVGHQAYWKVVEKKK